MKKIVTPYHHATRFEQWRTRDEMRRELQRLVKGLLQAIHAPDMLEADLLDDQKTVDLTILEELSYADLKSLRHPVFRLSEICRLLIKSGERRSLQLCLSLSHTLYAFQCQHDESRYISSCYKGIAQIGLQQKTTGIHHLLNGMTTRHDFTLLPVDQTLGFWALMNVAMLNRNLQLAVTFAHKWRDMAQQAELTGEVFRAKLALHLFHLLLDECESCLRSIEELTADCPDEWRGTVAFLENWTRSLTEDVSPASPDFYEPYPLFLGFSWHFSGDETQTSGQPSLCGQDARAPKLTALSSREGTVDHIYAEDFNFLCRVRRNFCREAARNRLSIEEIETYARCFARWELPRPLYDFETILKNKAADENLRSIMARLLGKRVLETVVNKTPLDPEVTTYDRAIILVLDVRKFSSLSEHRTPQEIFEILNPIFKIMHEELEPVGGTILEFVGDCIVIVFNTFHHQQTEIDVILRQTTCALQRIRVLNAMSIHAGLPEIQVGVGINQGEVALGYLGGLSRCHLTVLGNTINLAARIESSTKELPGDVIASSACFQGGKPHVWDEPKDVNFSVRDVGRHIMRNINEPVHLFGLSPLLRYWVDFVPMGFVASPERGVVYLDTGNFTAPGIIDHHYRAQDANSACELLTRRPDLLLDHLRDIPRSQIEFRLHSRPDLDCAASLYTAHEFLDTSPRQEVLARLASYVSQIDQGRIPRPDFLSDSLYGVFIAHQRLVENHYGSELTDYHILQAALRVIDAAIFLMDAHPGERDFASIFLFQPGWFRQERQLINDDLRQYHDDVAVRSHPYTASVNGLPHPAVGLWIDHPRSIFCKLWAQYDPHSPDGNGYPFLTINLSQPGKNRFLIRVEPDSGKDLNGLGQLLESHESQKRKALGQERPVQPIRYPADNSDPWYFGQGHNYTIIDSPWEGTVLTAEDVQQIHEHWRPKR